MGPSDASRNRVLQCLALSDTVHAMNAAIHLIMNGLADPVECDAQGTSPLTLALATENLPMSQLLMAFGADPKARDVSGVVPQHVAQGRCKRFLEVVDGLNAKSRRLVFIIIDSLYACSDDDEEEEPKILPDEKENRCFSGLPNTSSFQFDSDLSFCNSECSPDVFSTPVKKFDRSVGETMKKWSLELRHPLLEKKIEEPFSSMEELTDVSEKLDQDRRKRKSDIFIAELDSEASVERPPKRISSVMNDSGISMGEGIVPVEDVELLEKSVVAIEENDDFVEVAPKKTCLQKWLSKKAPLVEEKSEVCVLPVEETEQLSCQIEDLIDENSADSDKENDPTTLPEEERKKLELRELQKIWNLSNADLKRQLMVAGINSNDIQINKANRDNYEKHLLKILVLEGHKVVQNIAVREKKYSKQLEATLEIMSSMNAPQKSSTCKPKLGLRLGRNTDQKVRERFCRRAGEAFVYLLMDPKILGSDLSKATFQNFIDSIFYVGKGCKLRPLAHMCETKQLRDQNSTLLNQQKKLLKISSIWDAGMGVAKMEIGHGMTNEEAHIRESALIEAIMLRNLTNIKKGHHSITRRYRYSKTEQAEFGSFILYNALKVLRAQEVRLIYPEGLEKIRYTEKEKEEGKGRKEKKKSKKRQSKRVLSVAETSEDEDDDDLSECEADDDADCE
ncbi:unnamed protein product [Caenorhabditis auriculariae]|uniref:Uncharacterized protein n=1 Tax=Caenorhabditis auriculariae TaxID=2777116 RepID=A0A8S1HX54_9PELO|nr:unnamed protein product [Caenorhabditis auriculariae]